MKTLRLAALLLLVFNATLPAHAAGPRRTELPPVEGEVIVQFRADASLTRRHALAVRANADTVRSTLNARAATLGARLGRTLEAGAAIGERSQVLRASGMSATALAAALAADPDVEFAVPNGRRKKMVAPNDPLYAAAAPGVRPNGPDSGQWYLRAPAASIAAGPISSINIEGAWTRTTGVASIIVAVLDTGTRLDHPDLSGRLVSGYDFVSDPDVGNDGDGRDADPNDPGDWTSASENSTAGGKFYQCDPTGNGRAEATPSSWHGTGTAALVGAAANDNIGMAGAAPGVRVQAVRVLGKCFGSDSDIQAGMLWAAGLSVPGAPSNPTPAKVINLSLGGEGTCNAAYQSVVDRIIAQGVTVVAAAGNSAGHAVGTPANCSGVIAVTGIRHIGTKIGYSDLGPEVAIAAPGGNCVNLTGACLYPILTATNTGTTSPVSSSWSDSVNYSVGTSFATPLVAATAGLMMSAQSALTPAQLRERLRATARPFPTSGAELSVGQCHAPSTNRDQLECYCNTSYCGAGMLDASAAVQAAAIPVARIAIETAAPTAGSPVTLTAGSSLPPVGGTIGTYAWTVTNGGGIVSTFTGATNAVTATLTPSAAGSFTVQVIVSDNQGSTSTATQTVTVAAAPVVTPPPGNGGGDGGGGALGLAALCALLAAGFGLRAASRRA